MLTLVHFRLLGGLIFPLFSSVFYSVFTEATAPSLSGQAGLNLCRYCLVRRTGNSYCPNGDTVCIFDVQILTKITKSLRTRCCLKVRSKAALRHVEALANCW